jgi:hypothetical protein
MASHGQDTIESPQPDYAPGAQFVEYEEFIESQLRRTRSHVRSVDLAAGVMLLLAGTLSYFLLAALIDHWLVSGGLGFWGRLILWFGLLAGAGWWTFSHIVPLVIKRINPLYAAHTIERSRPTLKNSLVNFLLFRSDPSSVPQRVLEAIEEQAATNLVGVQVDSAVDRSRLIKLGYVLVGILTLCALYAVFSPKNLFQTIGRVAMPWADIQPPTRAAIDEIEPGSVQAFRGQQVTVKARVQGVAEGAPVTLYYSTADRQIVERPIEMSRPAGEYRYTAVLPAEDAVLQQSLTYSIKAGDATTRVYNVAVVAAPTIVVKSVEYRYPAYTGLLSQRVEQQGDLKAIEGTEVVLEALANQDIASGYVDFDANHTLDLPLRGEGPSAKASFKLFLKEDRQTPEHSSYQLSFKNAAGEQNVQPVRHQIEVTRDLSPEVQFVSPDRNEIEVPLDGAVDLEAVANDPDFALASVKLVMNKVKGTKPVEIVLLNEPWRGQFTKKYHFSPKTLKLHVGDIVEYYAVAVDNKSPRPNQSETARRKITIVAAANPGDDATSTGSEQGGGKNGAGEDGKPGDESKPGEGEQPKNDSGEKSATEKAAAEQGASQADSANPSGEQKAEPSQGAAKQQPEPNADKSADKQPEGQQSPASGEQGSAGEDAGSQGAQQKSSQGGESGGAQKGDEPSAGEQADGGAPGKQDSNSGQQQAPVASDGTNDGDAFERILKDREEQGKSDPQSGDKQQQDQQSTEQEQGGSEQSGDQQQGDQQQNAQQQGGEPSEGQKQSGGQQGGGEQGQQQAGDKQTGDQSGAGEQGNAEQGKQSGGQQGQQQGGQGQKQQGQGQQGDGKQSSQSPSGGEQNAKQPGDGQQGDGQQAGKKGGQKGKRQDGQPADGAQPGEKSDGKPSNQEGQQGNPNANQSDTKGQGAQSKGDTNPNGQQQPQAGGDKSDAQGGDGESEKGESGAGQESSDKQGSPGAQDANAPRDKSQGRQQGGEKKDGEEQSPSNSKRESDTEGDEDGDRSGGGKRGGGQKANQSGTGGAGQNTAADEGADRSQQAGGSETSGRAGEDQAADGKTGQSGQQTGPGSKQRPATDESGAPGGDHTQPSDGSQAGGKQQSDAGQGQSTASPDGNPGDPSGEQNATGSENGSPSGQPGEGSQRPDDGGEQQGGSGSRSGDSKSKQELSQQEGVGNPDENSEGAQAAQPNGQGSKSIVPPKKEWEAEADQADLANLEYSRKATDLAISHLKDELNKSPNDPKVLDKLGWTRQEAEKFVERWEAMRKSAKSTDKASPGGKRQLDDALRSLGLRPQGTTLSGSAARDDRTQGMQESRRTKPPAEYSEAFKAYTQGTTRGGK